MPSQGSFMFHGRSNSGFQGTNTDLSIDQATKLDNILLSCTQSNSVAADFGRSPEQRDRSLIEDSCD